MYKKILVCLDGSSLAEQVLPYASDEAKRFNSKLVLLQVITSRVTIPPVGVGHEFPPVSAAGPGYGAATEATQSIAEVEMAEIKKEENKAKGYLEGIAQNVRTEGVNVETDTVQGEAGESIVNYAAKHEIELIAIATHGRSGLGRAVFGSVADFVLRESGLPILVIKPG